MRSSVKSIMSNRRHVYVAAARTDPPVEKKKKTWNGKCRYTNRWRNQKKEKEESKIDSGESNNRVNHGPWRLRKQTRNTTISEEPAESNQLISGSDLNVNAKDFVPFQPPVKEEYRPRGQGYHFLYTDGVYIRKGTYYDPLCDLCNPQSISFDYLQSINGLLLAQGYTPVVLQNDYPVCTWFGILERKESLSPLSLPLSRDQIDDAAYRKLIKYMVSAEDLTILGYPVESKQYPGRAIIYKPDALDANSKEVVSGDESVKKKCMRCQKEFLMTRSGEYITLDLCVHHWGKLHAPPTGGLVRFYTCCQSPEGTKGCTTAACHVWSGVEPGTNGPFDGYVRTRKRYLPPQYGDYNIYSIDGEMCFTKAGLELTKISVVSLDGNLVYETFVRPENCIIDYNTRFSGITAEDMSGNNVKNLKEVQNDLMDFISADTILVGHGLESDLRALKMIHYAVIDTAIVFPHPLGLPYKRSLKSLVRFCLHKDIQVGSHDSLEDASACIELMKWKLMKDLHNDK